MPSLNLDLNYFDHVKTMRLLSRLGPGSDVLPIRLWAWVGGHQPESGRLEMLEAELELICRWWGEKGSMVAAMLEVGFLRRDGTFFRIHDWLDHSGHLASFKKRAVNAARIRWGLDKAPSNAKKQVSNAPSNALAVPCRSLPAKQDVKARPLSAISQKKSKTDDKPMTVKEMRAIRLKNLGKPKR